MADPVVPTPSPAPAAAPTPAAVKPAVTPTPAAPAPAVAVKPAGVLERPDPAVEAAPVQPDWPDDWRQKLAKGDDKVLKRLERYASPLDVSNALIAAQNKISSGEVKSVLAKDATPEELTAWRKDNGIPDAPDGYLEGLPQGVVIGDEDKELVKLFAKDMHDRNASPEIVHAAIQSYYKVQEKINAEVAEQDQKTASITEEALRAEMGGAYRPMVTGIRNYLATLPTELSEKLQGARLSDGTPLFANLEAVKWFNGIVRELNPASTVVPGAGADAGKSIDNELADLTKLMGNTSSEYWKGPKAEQLQSRFRELTDAKQRMGARA
jgi:hypothetical protein